MKAAKMDNERFISALMLHLAPVIRDFQQEHGQKIRSEFEQRLATVETIKGDKGDKGDPGEGIPGRDGKDGNDGRDGADGKDGPPGDIGLVPDDIANQIAGAVRMLAEAPPIVRDVKSINEPVVVQRGEAGPRGLPGLCGPAGEKGEKGDPGPRGRDGIGIAGAAISRDGDLLLTLSDGVILTLAIDKGTDNV